MPHLQYDQSDSEVSTAWKLDKTVNLGNLLVLLALIGSLFGMYNGLTNRMDLMQMKVDMMWRTFKFESER